MNKIKCSNDHAILSILMLFLEVIFLSPSPPLPVKSSDFKYLIFGSLSPLNTVLDT